MKELVHEYDNIDLEAADPVTMDDDTFKDIQLIQRGLLCLIDTTSIEFSEHLDRSQEDDRKLKSSQNNTAVEYDKIPIDTKVIETDDESITAVLPSQEQAKNA